MQKKVIPKFFIKDFPVRKTSGQRFFSNLKKELSGKEDNKNFQIILFNISAPIKEIMTAKLLRKKIVLRVDGLYFDRLSEHFIKEFNFLVRPLLKFSLKFNFLLNFFTFFSNLLNQNYTGFLRVILADKIIYQSQFSKNLYDNYFPNKKSAVIINGGHFKSDFKLEKNKTISLIAIHDSFRPSKRIDQIVNFIEWSNKNKEDKIFLNLVGYDRKFPNCIDKDINNFILQNRYINTHPRFNNFDDKIKHLIRNSDMGVSFSYKDACPNTTIELMAYGLPFIYYKSGGLEEIIRGAGVGLKFSCSKDGIGKKYFAHRFENDFPSLDFEELYDAVIKIKKNRGYFSAIVKERFEDELDIKVVAEKYLDAMRI